MPYCTSCGVNNHANATFCSACGNRLQAYASNSTRRNSSGGLGLGGLLAVAIAISLLGGFAIVSIHISPTFNFGSSTNSSVPSNDSSQSSARQLNSSQPFQCPSVDQVSQWANSSVSRVPNESCAFTIDGHGTHISGAICTNQDGGTTVEYTPVSEPNTLVIQACNGSQLPEVWGFTIRFVAGYPAGDAGVCSLAQNAPKSLPSGWTVQANC